MSFNDGHRRKILWIFGAFSILCLLIPQVIAQGSGPDWGGASKRPTHKTNSFEDLDPRPQQS